MDDFVVGFATFTAFCLGFSFIWGVLVFGLASQEQKKTPEDQTLKLPKGVIRQCYAGIALMLAAMVYFVATNSIDNISLTLAAVGMMICSVALWRTANFSGQHAFATDLHWHKARAKSLWQALILILLIYAFNRLEPYIDALFT